MSSSVNLTAGVGSTASTGDAAIDVLVAAAGQTAQLPVGEHKAVYSRVIEGLERELDADPAAAMNAAAAAAGSATDNSATDNSAPHPLATQNPVTHDPS